MVALFAVIVALAFGGSQTTYTQPWHQTAPLAAGGEIEVDNLYGDVVVERGPDGSVDIAAVKKAYRQGDLDGVGVHVDVVEGAVKVTTDYPSSWHFLHHVDRWVDYQIRVPAKTKVILRLKYGDGRVESVGGPVDAQTRYGDIEARNAGGDQYLITEYGDVKLSVVTSDGGHSVTARSTYGDIDVELPATSLPDIEANTRFGDVNNDFEQTAHAGPKVDLRTTFGDVTISKEFSP